MPANNTLPRPPQYIKQNGRNVINPAYLEWQRLYGPKPTTAPASTPTTPGSKVNPTPHVRTGAATDPKKKTTTQTGGSQPQNDVETVTINGEQWQITYDANGKVINRKDLGPAPTNQPPGGGTQIPAGIGGGGGGAMTAYEQAQIALDKQKLADAEAQQKADQAYREAQAVDQFNKNWQDYQVKNYYGSFYGPSAAAPAGSPWAFRLPEPSYIQDYYKNNPQAGPDPWSQPLGFSGYSGSGYLNPQQPGIQNAGAVPAGSVAAPIKGQAPANPFPGATQGSVAYNPNAAQTGQNVAPPIGGKVGGDPHGMPVTMGGQSAGLDPNLLNIISSHPAANQFVMSLPGASQFVSRALGQQGPSSTINPPVAGGTNG